MTFAPHASRWAYVGRFRFCGEDFSAFLAARAEGIFRIAVNFPDASRRSFS